jgi:preprotein translocase subunit SecE
LQSKFKKRGADALFKVWVFIYIRAWCNGSIRVSKTFDLGSNPSARAFFYQPGRKADNRQRRHFSHFHTNNMSKFGTYIQESYDELIHKVSWPSWSELQQTTLIVLVSLAIVTALIFGMDSASEAVMKLVYGMAGN